MSTTSGLLLLDMLTRETPKAPRVYHPAVEARKVLFPDSMSQLLGRIYGALGEIGAIVTTDRPHGKRHDVVAHIDHQLELYITVGTRWRGKGAWIKVYTIALSPTDQFTHALHYPTHG